MLSCDTVKGSTVHPYYSTRKLSDAPSRRKFSTSFDVLKATARRKAAQPWSSHALTSKNLFDSRRHI